MSTRLIHSAAPTFFAGLACCFQATLLAQPPTALDRYVHAPDPAYQWHLVNTLPGEGYTTYVLEMTSQTWLTSQEVDRPVWKHWITITRPTEVRHDTALLFIGGGSNDRPAPTTPSKELAATAVATHSVVAELRMVPNQPLTFVGDGKPRVEDELVAYTWDKFLRTGDEKWPARLPMTKSAVRAMDTVSAFCASPEGGQFQVSHFFVAGGSKRGWTTWTTAAVDPRVVGIAPIVIDLLNLEPSFIHHFQVYGFFAPAVHDYVELGIMEWQGTPEYRKLLNLVEPYAYRQRFTMPKFIINASGDQFFVPDSSQFYFDDLPNPKFLRYVPNADHSLKDSDAYETLAASYSAVLYQTPLPQFHWINLPDGAIEVHASTPPTAVTLWQATNPNARDFRLETLGRAWLSQPLASTANDPHAYVARINTPAHGWSAFFVELTFDNPPGPAQFKFTTGVRVLPDVLPYPYSTPTTHQAAHPQPPIP